MDAQPQGKPPSAKVFWLVWLTLVALAAGSFVFLFQVGFLSTKATVFRQTARGWEPLAPLGTLAYNIRISERGVVWVQTAKGLSRLEGTSWHHFTASDFGTERGYLYGDFALDGEQVWAAGSGGIVHFDGTRWRIYADSVAMQYAASLAVRNGQVWTINRTGNLSHFDGAAWTTQKLNLPGVRWSVWAEPIPKLAVTGNGALWLVYQGLWRYQDALWKRVPGTGNEARLLGTVPAGEYLDHGKKRLSRGGIWVYDAGELAGYDVDGAPVRRYNRHDLGLLDSATIYGGAGRTPVWAVASSQGLVWFDGSRWHGDQISALGITTASRVAVAPDGSVWGVGYPHRTRPSRLLGAASLANLVLPFAIVIYPIWWWRRRSRYRRQAAQEAVMHATGSLPEDLQGPAPSGWKTAAGVVVILLVTGGSYALVKARWPNAPVWLLPAFFVAIHFTSEVLGSLKKRKPLPSDPIGPGGPPNYDWGKSVTPILGSVALLVLLYGGSIARHFHIPWLAATPGIVLLFGGQFLVHLYDVFRGHRVERQTKQCHYGKALELLDGPLGWPATVLLKMQRTDVLFFSGRAADAEPILRELVESQRNTGLRTLAFEHLGRVQMAQGRYPDARRCFEAAAKLMPSRPAAYSGLAEVRLRQSVETTQALEDAERALQLHRDSLLERKGSKERLAAIRGNQAWALAALGRGNESQQAIEAGVREMDPKFIPEVAGFYWRAGMAMLALENTNAAAGHLRRAAELDPLGYYGKLAAQHLKQHSVWGGVGVASR
jgi:hypothetical protein